MVKRHRVVSMRATAEAGRPAQEGSPLRVGTRARWLIVSGMLVVAVLGPAAPASGVEPTITSFSPASGPVGTVVTINGTDLTGATAVTFNNTPATFAVNSATKITATVPLGAATGRIRVSTPGGTGMSREAFIVSTTGEPPAIRTFHPTSGPVGTQVTITGLNFTGSLLVAFHGAAAIFIVNSSSQITATVPAGATTGTISVTTPGGTATSGVGFTVIGAAPTITSFIPTSGPVGTFVTITGTSFLGATAVKFHGTLAVFTVNSSSQITATVPAGATTGTISVTTPSGTATSAGQFTVTTVPTITSFHPASGPVGTVVTVAGSNFTGATSVKFHGISALFAVNSSSQITATVPAGATAGTVSVMTPSGTATSNAAFAVVHARTVTVHRERAVDRVLVGQVQVSDGFAMCAGNVPVKIQRLAARWRTVGLAMTGSGGVWRHRVGRPGTYRAVADAVTLTTGDVCAMATSRTLGGTAR